MLMRPVEGTRNLGLNYHLSKRRAAQGYSPGRKPLSFWIWGRLWTAAPPTSYSNEKTRYPDREKVAAASLIWFGDNLTLVETNVRAPSVCTISIASYPRYCPRLTEMTDWADVKTSASK